MTAIAGAIRVQGHYLLKAFIGRARENYAAAEIEYMSSTSKEVCELFNGKGIVRTMGNPSVAQLVVLSKRFPKPGEKSFDLSCGIYTLESATNDNVMYGKGTCYEASAIRSFEPDINTAQNTLITSIWIHGSGFGSPSARLCLPQMFQRQRKAKKEVTTKKNQLTDRQPGIP
jgi:hypothetical protein